jgi:hypothetical protein
VCVCEQISSRRPALDTKQEAQVREFCKNVLKMQDDEVAKFDASDLHCMYYTAVKSRAKS